MSSSHLQPLQPDPGFSARAASSLRQARQQAGLSLRALAQRAGTSHATLSAYEQGHKSPNLDTFMRILDACGFAVQFTLEPRIRAHQGLARDEELQAVLALAAQFPARHGLEPDTPPLRLILGGR